MERRFNTVAARGWRGSRAPAAVPGRRPESRAGSRDQLRTLPAFQVGRPRIPLKTRGPRTFQRTHCGVGARSSPAERRRDVRIMNSHGHRPGTSSSLLCTGQLRSARGADGCAQLSRHRQAHGRLAVLPQPRGWLVHICVYRRKPQTKCPTGVTNGTRVQCHLQC